MVLTARTRDNTNKAMLDGSNFLEATPFDHGSGHMRPNRAMDPGLVYDLSTDDYFDFLCALGYNQTLMQSFSKDPYECPKSISLLDFNYPSITVPYLRGSATVARRVKNVGSPGTYVARVIEPPGISVSVKPRTLTFDQVGEEKSFKVTLKVKYARHAMEYVFGGLRWSDGRHYVRSPIVVGLPN